MKLRISWILRFLDWLHYSSQEKRRPLYCVFDSSTFSYFLKNWTKILFHFDHRKMVLSAPKTRFYPFWKAHKSAFPCSYHMPNYSALSYNRKFISTLVIMPIAWRIVVSLIGSLSIYQPVLRYLDWKFTLQHFCKRSLLPKNSTYEITPPPRAPSGWYVGK